MTNKEHIQALFNNEDTERIADFLSDIGSDCDECRIRDFCARSIVYSCKGVWQEWLESKYKE